MSKINIAIDGLSACGKSTLAKQLAKSLNYIYLDTGAMYRSVTYFALKNKWVSLDKINEKKIIEALPNLHITFEYNTTNGELDTFLNGKNIEKSIRTLSVAKNVSKVSQIPEVRKRLISMQRKIAKKKGVVMDGRDIGSVVLPDSKLKLFMTASHKVRVQRRFEELTNKGVEITIPEVEENLSYRDEQDSTRKLNPLIQTEDAVVIDNTDLSHEEQLNFVLRLVAANKHDKVGA